MSSRLLPAHLFAAAAMAALAQSPAPTSPPVAPPVAPASRYAMTAALWQGDKASFATDETFPNGLMTVASGYALLKTGDFADGTIEFDIKPLAYADTGILFHRRDADTAEFVYLRANPDCPAANDCVQYAPVTNGRMQWNSYSQYQNSAPISDKGWNHLRIVVAHGRMRLFVNHAAEPLLDVPHLRGLVDHGGIAVKGPAVYANLVVRPGDSGEPTPPLAEASATGMIRHWQIGPVTPAPSNRPVGVADVPQSGWAPFETEPDGLANLARAIPRNTTPGLKVAWLRVVIDAASDGEKTVDLGFVPRAWLFLNGAPAYAGENFYYPADKRLAPAGRFAPDNAQVTLALHKGRNVLLLATDDAWRSPDGALYPDHYGWAAMVRFEDPAGLTFDP